MINNIKKAIEHFSWKLKTCWGKSWKPTQTDVEALNFIMEYANMMSKKQLTDNQLFAKLYIFAYGEYLIKHGATVFDSELRKRFNKNLARPIENLIEEFKNDLNTTELYQSFLDKGIPITHPHLLTKEERERMEVVTDVWNYDTVKEMLERDINNILTIHNENIFKETT